MAIVPEVTLNSGHQMPLIGFGTAAFPFADSNTVKQAMLCGIKNGYRHFDTAAAYYTENSLGEVIAEALDHGLTESRDELFITSKLWCGDAHQDRVIPALQKTLQNLQLEYIDLYLIHWPVSSQPGKCEFPIPTEELIPMDFESVWKAMEECQRLGLTKSIGVSNFSCKKIEQLLTTATIIPAVNEVEMNPLWRQNKLREFCKAKGIVVSGYSPLGAKGTPWGTNRVMENEVLKQIAQSKGKTHAQVCLRWGYEQGVCLVVKSFNEERMKENLKIFDWALTDEETKQISQIPQSRGCDGEIFVSAEGPFKSVDDLWDEKMSS